MSTKADLRTRILDDLSRSGTTWSTRVDNAVADAIGFYQPKRFYFNYDRSFTFSTVIGQTRYAMPVPDASITPDISNDYYGIDDLWLTISSAPTRLTVWPYTYLEFQLESDTSRGQPYAYARINRALLLYPTPVAVYTGHILGHYKVAAPANDAETGNVWMNEAFELIRSRAKAQIAMHILEDEALANRMEIMERSALANLRSQSSYRTDVGMIIPTQF